MASIELYINKQLCDIENPNNFSVYLKRQLINPSELSTKDAQRSYDITLPASPTNNSIFGHTNTEEVKGKFAQLYDAMLYVDSIKIFEGKFRMSEITKTYYKGNLGIPAAKTVKDIFGEKKMNDGRPWLINFSDYNSISEINEMDNPACFFPFVLYGLIPKEPLYGAYSKKDEWDDTVNINYKHIPPSINCLLALKEIFASEGYTLGGSAFQDERISRLYMSYRNPEDYIMPWNYGRLAKMEIKGIWGNHYNNVIENSHMSDINVSTYNADLLYGKNAHVDIIDGDGNFVQQEQTDDGRKKTTIKIPADGLYKIMLDANIDVPKGDIPNSYEERDGVTIIRTNSRDFFSKDTRNEDFLANRYEVKVMRYPADADCINLGSFGYDNKSYKNNQNQEFGDGNSPHLFSGAGEVNFVDPAQNENLLCGLSFGRWDEDGNSNHMVDDSNYPNPIAIKNGKSWDERGNYKQSISAVAGKGYYNAKANAYQTRTDRYKIEMENLPFDNYAKYSNNHLKGEGKICQVAWLNAGEKITVVTNSREGYHVGGARKTGWVLQFINFSLTIEAFRTEDSWVQVDNDNTGTGVMNWEDDTTFLTDNLDLRRFLPSETKIDEWTDNFCKAFNLNLIQTSDKAFELNTKLIRAMNTSLIIDLDKKGDINCGRQNTSLSLPSAYELGFTVDKEEEGYKLWDGEDGGGIYKTSSTEDKKISQKSNFSYNWTKNIINTSSDKEMKLPIISAKEPWTDIMGDYGDMQKKQYYSKAQRFWYKSKETFAARCDKATAQLSLVSNRLDGNKQMVLDYKDGEYSILRNYFALLTDADNSYTTIECYLSPEEYRNIDTSLIKLNDDLYYVAEVDGYDPLCRKKTTLRLIRKQL